MSEQGLTSPSIRFSSQLLVSRFINARRRIVQPIVDDSNRTGSTRYIKILIMIFLCHYAKVYVHRSFIQLKVITSTMEMIKSFKSPESDFVPSRVVN